MPLTDDQLKELGQAVLKFYSTLDAFKKTYVEKLLPPEIVALLKKN